MELCENTTILLIFRIISLLIGFVKVMIPIVIIITTIIELFKCTMVYNPEDVKKVYSKVPVKLIAAMVVFMLPGLVNSALNMVDSNFDNKGIACLLKVDEIMISNARIMRAERAVSEAEKKNDYSKFIEALSYIQEIEDEDKKKVLLDRIKPMADDFNSTALKISRENLVKLTKKEKEIREKKQAESSGNTINNLVFIGDSRTVGMYNALGFGSSPNEVVGTTDSNGDTWYAKVSQGYDWMMNTAIKGAESKISSGTGVIILMGVNDLGNVDKYTQSIIDKSKSWESKGATTFFVSVNPINDSLASSRGYFVRNSGVEEFNKKLISGISKSKVKYIDTYSVLSGNFKTVDGLHYDNSTYKKIYDAIKKKVEAHNKVANNSKSSSIGGNIDDSGIAYYNQCTNSAFNPITLYDGVSFNSCQYGCGWFAFSMVADHLLKQNNTPIHYVNKLYPYNPGGADAMYDSTLVSLGVVDIGLSANVIFDRLNIVPHDEQENRKNLLMKSLKSGHSIVLLIPGHFIALIGLDKEGKIIVRDSGGQQRNGSYTIDELSDTYYNYSNRCYYSDFIQCGFVYAVEYKRK